MSDTILITVGILEDDEKITGSYINYLEKWRNATRNFSLDTFNNGIQLLQEIHQKQYDVLFLDIVLQNAHQNGIMVANELRKAGYSSLIVFVTHFSDYWPKGYDVGAFRYYLKPLSYDDFSLCMEHATKKKLGKYFKYSFNEEHKIIPYDNIQYFSIQGHYVTIHPINGEAMKMLDTFKNLKKMVPGNFVQCHRSFLVNLDHVYSFKGNQLTMANGDVLYISQTYLQNIRSEFIRWVR